MPGERAEHAGEPPAARSTDERLRDLISTIDDLADGRLHIRSRPDGSGDLIDQALTGINRLAGHLSPAAPPAAADERPPSGQTHDALTGLAHRVTLSRMVERALSDPTKQPVAVAILDLDGFKTVNDALGHRAGDDLLIEFGQRLMSSVQPEATVARLGGDEFAVLLPGCIDDQAIAQLNEVIATVNGQYTIGGRQVWLTASAGVRVSGSFDTAETMIRDADTAMYQAKESGGGRVIAWNAKMHLRVQSRLRMVAELGAAIDDDQLRLLFQPIVDLRTGRLTGVEALCRWHHPFRGMIMPIDFIPVAEQSGLIVPLGRWVVLQALRQLSEWAPLLAPERHFQMHVNLSPIELIVPDLPDFIAQAIDRFGVDKRRVTLEIAESALVTDGVESQNALRGLRELGTQLEIDDFGTGYSSISYLRRLPVESVKVDRSLIKDLGVDPQCKDFVGAVLRLIESVGKRAVIEGVETQEQVRLLRELGCERAQGFYFGTPMTADQLAPMLSR